MALDVNTSEDLGEIILHGTGTETRKFLLTSGLDVKVNHGNEKYTCVRVKNMIAMTIPGFDPSGSTGILNDIKTFHAMGAYNRCCHSLNSTEC